MSKASPAASVPMLLLGILRNPQNQQQGRVTYSRDFLAMAMAFQEVARSLEAWKLAAGSAEGFEEP